MFKKNNSEITAILNILSTHDGSSKTKILDNTKKREKTGGDYLEIRNSLQ